MTIYTAKDASAWASTLGVNTHMAWPNTAPYSNTQGVLNALNYLGVHNVRDGIGPWNASQYDTLAHAGVKFDIVYNPAGAVSDFVSQLHTMAVTDPGAIKFAEGPNEVDGATAQATIEQQALYTQVHADSALGGVAVLAPTIASIEQSAYSGLNVAGYADFGNIHMYFNGGMPEYGVSPTNTYWSFDNWLASGNYDVPGKPVGITETGAANFPSSANGVDDATQAKQIVDALMDGAQRGVPFTYLYELADSQQVWSSGELNGHWGLFNFDMTPKPAATAVHNLLGHLTDGGPGGSGTLDYNIQGTPQWGGQMLFAEGNGAKDIVVWAEPDIWNESTHTAIPAPNTPITIDLAQAAKVDLYDPLTGTTTDLGTTSHIAFNVTDHPVIVEVAAGSGSTTTTTTTTTTAPTTTTTTTAPTTTTTTTTTAPTTTTTTSTIPGAPTTPDLTAASDTGSSNTDNITKVTTPTLVGSAVAGSHVNLYDGSTLVGSATTDSTGHWSITTSNLADGSHVLTATASTSAGVSAASAGLTVKVDTWAPSAPSTPDLTAASDNGVSNTDNVTTVTNPTFTGTVASAPNAIVTLHDGATTIGTATVDSAGNWSITSTSLAVGTHSITATATDVAGNVSQDSGILAVTIQSTPGVVINGTRGSDNLLGTSGADTISGGRGSDTITGGAGDDQLTGGTGADHFVFKPGFGHDVITDFQHAQSDLLAFSGFNGAQPTVTDTTAGMVLRFGTGDTVTLAGVHSLYSNDWIVQ